ncbi:MAG TPA: protein kinase [Actinospica sp.]|nr:protein kinase [Actinospica sp.]
MDEAAARRRLRSLVSQGRRPRAAGLAGAQPARAAWPLVRIETVHGAVPGFLMVDLAPGRLSLESSFAPAGRSAAFPDATWADALRAALDLAVLVRDMHAAEYVLGDLKAENLWVDAVGRIALCDVDSVQFTADGEFFRCTMGSPGYTAPELIDAAEYSPTVESDAFSLAVLIYQILLCGVHPFHGVPRDGGAYVGFNDNIRNGRAVLLGPEAVRLDPTVPAPRLLPRALRALFRRCFDAEGRGFPDRRPSPGEWCAAVAEALQPSRLRCCTRVSRHVYAVELPWCPWCDLLEHGRDFYPSAPGIPVRQG